MIKGKKKGWITTLAAGCAVTIGAGLLVAVYQKENQFQPVGADRDIQINQVVFSQDENGAGYAKKESGNDGEIWQKDHKAEEKNRPGIKDGADYLYEDGKLEEADPGNGVLNQNDQNIADLIGNWNSSEGSTGSGSTAYGLTDDADQADLIIAGGMGGLTAGGSGINENGDAENNGEPGKGNSSASGNSESGTGLKPAPSGNPAPAPSKMPQPGTRPADTVKDPEADISNKSNSWENDPDIPIRDYDESKFKGTEETNYNQVIIQKPSGSSLLYLGQNVDQRIIFNSLDTCVWGSDRTMYTWKADALGKYIRIDGVSLDGGESWITDFPMTIPADTDQNSFSVKASYRFSETGKWTEKEIPYKLEDGCLYILKNALTDGNGVLQKEDILNGNAKYPAAGQNIILYGYQMGLYDVVPDSCLYELFPGWQENGEATGWFYQTGNGRHILEPMEMVKLDDGYTVQLKLAWMDNDGQVGSGLEYNNLVYLQTLTGVMETAKTAYQRSFRLFGEKEEKLTVPDYIQAVQLEDDPLNFWLAAETDYLEIPESVVYVDLSKSTFRVNNGYLVDKGNPYYKSEIGMLVNQEGTKILGIPYNMKKVTVPETCQEITIAQENQIREIVLESDNMDKLRGISYGNLTNCKITIQDELLQDFLAENYEEIFQNEGNQVVLQDSKAAYMVKKDAIVSTDGELYKVIDTAGKEITLAPEVTRIGEEAFSEQPGIEKLILDKGGKTVELLENCFKDSKINSIICYTQEQYDSITKQLKKIYPEETYPEGSGISVQYPQTSKEGHEYLMESQNGTEEITVIRAARDCTVFDGTITTEAGETLTVTEIGDNAFADCDQLVMVSLPEAVHRIGYQAFKNCASLEGVFSEAITEIVIGNKAFDGCSRLQFIAFNAEEAEMQGGYNPKITDGHMYTFYAPADSSGYGEYAYGFYEVTGYDLINAGENGWLLYGHNAEEKDWLLLKGVGEMAPHISLPDATLEVYYYAMEGTGAEEDYYQIDNLGSIKKLYLDTGAFKDSALGGAVTLGETGIPDDGNDSVFLNCSEITEISMESINALPMCIFSGCRKLQKLTLKSTVPPSFTIYPQMEYRFFGWNEDDLEGQLSLSVPAGSEETYIRAWRYLIAGYADISSYNQTAYNNWWQEVQYTLLSEKGEMPADREVDERLKAEMLKAENRIRGMMGMEAADEPVDYYPYHINDEGFITLAGIPAECTSLDIAEAEEKVLLSGWTFDYVAADAFQGTALQELIIPETLVALESGFLNGITSDHITMKFKGRTEFTGETREAPFCFGTDESRITIQVPSGEEEDFISLWSYPMAGYQDRQEMLVSLPMELKESKGEDPTDEEIHLAMAEKLLGPVNRLRSMMGLSQLTLTEMPDYPKELSDPSDENDELVPDSDEEESEEKKNPEEKETEEEEPEEQKPEEKETEEKDPDAENNKEPGSTEEGAGEKGTGEEIPE